jgi:hypothetical protein
VLGQATYVMSLFPIHVIRLMLLTHLLLECNVAAPVRGLIFQTYRKPSCAVPMLARYRESGLKATQLTPNECSARAVKGVSEGASGALESVHGC